MWNSLFALWVLSAVAVVYIQVRYAKANYPRSLRWKSLVFLTAFGSGVLAAVTIFQEVSRGELLVASILLGSFFGLIFTFVFPLRMQLYYPKQKTDQ